MAGYLAAEEEDPGEAGGGDAAPDDDGGGEQRPVAVDHRRRRSFAPGAADRSMGDWRRRRGERGIGPKASEKLLNVTWPGVLNFCLFGLPPLPEKGKSDLGLIIH
ncbi:hypothetical protein OsI_21437 [Oryza sativa Indica Group]|uniref:Uncharacterized protein n=1 Tax=Oryza sativa subsp. indica TaxID=39946 RepID=A2Y8R0_ORYSI|nr:hypothetical protein OsI_21437 [Oryza sativa Indica Group]